MGIPADFSHSQGLTAHIDRLFHILRIFLGLLAERGFEYVVIVAAIRHLFYAVLLVSLTGCFGDDPAIAQFETYQQRLANVVETDPLPLSESISISLPRKRDLLLPLEDIRMGLLDAYELRECGLFQLIADRNSILGKVQDAFRHLDYEIKLLNTVAYCLSSIENDPLIEQLTALQKQKSQQLTTVYWNTFVSSDAWRKQLIPAGNALIPPEKPFPHSDALLAIERYANLIEQKAHEVDALSLQEPIEKQHYLGAVFLSLDESTRWLNTITQQLERDDHLIVCGENRDPTRLNYLRNVFDTFFIGAVQPYVSTLNGLYLDVQPSLHQLNETITIAPSHFHSYQHAYLRGDRYDEFQRAVKHHVQYWQSLFSRCQITVGRQ
ncbi:DUF3080 family protein [Enterovibrio norvegicus]|uniref:DUF3080 family protein n=1 Tax=Enterovibrio norvegicus TaxID=188144 RepID=A0ABV4L936_9GAMM|nr:DUF3080 family protein [Enterovibrio norvegicus]OEF58153.1 hypothetical protein A1OU_08100 [Enterovibrio norvegicus]